VRLCFIANPDSILTRRWVSNLAERGHEIHLVSRSPRPPLYGPNVIFHTVPMPFFPPKVRTLALGYQMRRIVRTIQPDVLHAHQASLNGVLAAMTGFHPLVIMAWGSDLLVRPKASRIDRLLIRWALRRADHVICVSENLAQVARSLGADPSRLEVTPWGVDMEIFYPAPPSTQLREQLGLASGPIVLSIRAMRPLYNPLDIAHAIPLVLAQVPEAQFIILTYRHDPDLLGQFQSIIQEEHATQAVHYVGDLPDDRAIAEIYRLADIALSVPSSDGTPNSVLEALACGTALVVGDLPSLREWITDQRDGLIVPVGEPGALSTAIVRLLREDAFRRQLQANGLALVRQRADHRFWMAHAEETYESLIGDEARITRARNQSHE
jgi:glycosyltransferase involved in cell wall biosynthesis